MAELESSLRTYLLTKTGITSIFSTRIYVDRIDQRNATVYPFAIIRTIAEAPGYAHDGALPDKTLVQIDVYSDSKTTVNSGTTAIKTELSGYSGAMGSLAIGSSFITDTRGQWDPEARIFMRSTDVSISQNG